MYKLLREQPLVWSPAMGIDSTVWTTVADATYSPRKVKDLEQSIALRDLYPV